MKKPILIVLVALALVLSVCGCESSETAETSATGPQCRVRDHGRQSAQQEPHCHGRGPDGCAAKQASATTAASAVAAQTVCGSADVVGLRRPASRVQTLQLL
jgi:hypothetical protein